MDLVLTEFDRYVGDKLYASLAAAAASPTAQQIARSVGAKLSIESLLSRESVPRQLMSLFALTCQSRPIARLSSRKYSLLSSQISESSSSTSPLRSSRTTPSSITA